MKFAAFKVHVPEDQSFKKILRVKLPIPLSCRKSGSRMNPACVLHEKWYFPRIYVRHTCKGKLELSEDLTIAPL